jgi:outer membrane protein OmpA-like peptidoglycan-associated protein
MADLKFVRGAGGVKVLIGKSQSVAIPPRVLRAQLANMRFDTDKAFLLPEALHGIRRIVHFYNDHDGMHMVIVGHTDLRADRPHNQRLSEDRARAVKAYLQDDVATWSGFYGPGTTKSQPWGIREDEHMLSHLVDKESNLPFYTGLIDGKNTAEYREAVQRYQASRSLDQAGIGSDTRKHMIAEYMAEDGTTLPGDVVVETHGCGENHPIKPIEGDVPENRRVEIFLFDGPPTPPVPKTCGPCTEQPEWLANATLHVDLTADLGDLGVLVTDRKARPMQGVMVRLDGPASASASASDQSDAEGRADFHNLSPGTYQLRGLLDGFAHDPQSVVIEGGRATEAKLVLHPLTLEIVDEDESVVTAVEFGLWDDAFTSFAGTVRQSDPGGNDFCAADSRRFRIRVRDQGVTTGSVDVLWTTLDSKGGDLDAPSASGAQAPAAITCEEVRPGARRFLSPFLMLVCDASDLAEPVHHGLKVAPPGPALRTTGLYNRRIRRGSMEGSTRVRYPPSTGGNEIERVVPVFERVPERRRRLPVQVFVLRDDTGAPMTPVTPGSRIFTVDFAVTTEIFERIGVKFETVVGPIPKGGQLIVDPATQHQLLVVDHPFPVTADKLKLTAAEEDALGQTFPMAAPRTIRVFLTYTPADGRLGSARPDFAMKLNGFNPVVQGCCFVQAEPRKIYTFAHEIGHVVTDQGHYVKPADPSNHRFAEQNLMQSVGGPTTTVISSGSSKRLWDDRGVASEPATQAGAIAGDAPSPYTRPF